MISSLCDSLLFPCLQCLKNRKEEASVHPYFRLNSLGLHCCVPALLCTSFNTSLIFKIYTITVTQSDLRQCLDELFVRYTHFHSDSICQVTREYN